MVAVSLQRLSLVPQVNFPHSAATQIIHWFLQWNQSKKTPPLQCIHGHISIWLERSYQQQQQQSEGDGEYWDKIWDVAQDISTTEIYVCYIM